MVPKAENIEVERHPYGGLVIYEISGDELDALEKETAAISEDLSFALVGLSSGAAFSIALATTIIQSDRTFVVFVVVTILSYIAALYFGIRWLRARTKTTTIVAKIKKRVGPLGEEDKVLEPQELASLPTQKVSGQEIQRRDNARYLRSQRTTWQSSAFVRRFTDRREFVVTLPRQYVAYRHP